MSILKAVVLGDSEVGKTSFTKRWTQGTFPEPEVLKTTIGASFDTLQTVLSNGKEVTLSIWDFGGQRRFIESLKSMVLGAKIGLFFFDASYLPTLDSLYNYWVPLAEEYGDFDFKSGDGKRLILVANKIDLLRGDLSMLESEMQHFVDRFGTESVMISAKTGIGIEQLDYKFKKICEDYV